MNKQIFITQSGIMIGCRYDPKIDYNDVDQWWVRVLFGRPE